MSWIKNLRIFNIIWSVLLLLYFINTQFSFWGAALLGIFSLITTNGISKKSVKMRLVFLRWSIPFGVLAGISLIPFTDPKMPDYIRMTTGSMIRFWGWIVALPIIINFFVLMHPKVKEQFQ